MSNFTVESTNPDPAAAALSNEQTVSKDGGDPSAPTDTEAVMAGAGVKESNGLTHDEIEEKTAENGTPKNSKLSTYENGMLKTTARERDDGRSNSKYDPSILPETDDPKKIRAQVGSKMSSSVIFVANISC